MQGIDFSSLIIGARDHSALALMVRGIFTKLCHQPHHQAYAQRSDSKVDDRTGAGAERTDPIHSRGDRRLPSRWKYRNSAMIRNFPRPPGKIVRSLIVFNIFWGLSIARSIR